MRVSRQTGHSEAINRRYRQSRPRAAAPADSTAAARREDTIRMAATTKHGSPAGKIGDESCDRPRQQDTRHDSADDDANRGTRAALRRKRSLQTARSICATTAQQPEPSSAAARKAGPNLQRPEIARLALTASKVSNNEAAGFQQIAERHQQNETSRVSNLRESDHQARQHGA